MPRPTFADPRNDFVFRRVFGSEERVSVLVAFLNDMLDLDEAHRIVGAELLGPEQRPPVTELMFSILDVKCTDARGVRYTVAMQVLRVEGFDRHLVDNVLQADVNQHARGECHLGPDDLVGITICDFVLWPDTDERRLPMLTRWRMAERETGAKAGLGQVQLVFLELPKYDPSRPPQTLVEKWAHFFREVDNLTVIPEVLAEYPFTKALDAARIACFTVDEWDPYILAGIAIQNRRGALAMAEKRGQRLRHEEGRKAGLGQGVRAVCGVLRIELTEERRRELASLNTTALEALLARLKERRSWG